jgi:DNA-binding SARP family transcriptional activator
VRWAVLGQVMATMDGRVLPLGPPQQRGALAYLLINANLLISPDQLVQALWGTAAPASARTQVYGYVSRLRRAVGPGADDILTGGPAGYRLTAAAGDLDVAEFTGLIGQARAAVAGGQPAEAAERYRAALARWTGAALSGAAGAYVASAALRLEEQRLVAVEELTDVELGLDRHATLVPQLQALVAANPLRERLVGQLMLALYRGGRQAEALAVFGRYRRTLGDEHGLDPGARLAELHESIIRADRGLLALPSSKPPVARPAPPRPRPR